MQEKEVVTTPESDIQEESQALTHDKSEEKTSWTQDSLLQISRRFNIDLSPKVLLIIGLHLLIIIYFMILVTFC